MRCVFLALMIAGCSKSSVEATSKGSGEPTSKSSGEPTTKRSGETTCKRAGEKVAACFKEKMGDDEMVRTASKNATSDASVQACAADAKIVAAFEKCISISDCDKFMECAEGQVATP